MVERILADFDVAYNLKSVFATLTLLVLNGLLGEDHNPETPNSAGTDDGFG